MTRARYEKLMVAMCEKIQYKYNNKHLTGDILKFYRGRKLTDLVGFKSYAEAWESLKPARDLVNM